MLQGGVVTPPLFYRGILCLPSFSCRWIGKIILYESLPERWNINLQFFSKNFLVYRKQKKKNRLKNFLFNCTEFPALQNHFIQRTWREQHHRSSNPWQRICTVLLMVPSLKCSKRQSHDTSQIGWIRIVRKLRILQKFMAWWLENLNTLSYRWKAVQIALPHSSLPCPALPSPQWKEDYMEIQKSLVPGSKVCVA